MIKTIEIKLLPDDLNDEEKIRNILINKSKVKVSRITEFKLVRKSVDARGRIPKFVLRFDLYIDELPKAEIKELAALNKVELRPSAIIIGAGPAGYFAALELIKLRIKPIILERGKDVRSRRKDLRAIQQFGEVNPNSNYCFGEGGAGTYSDGKLYTKSLKRGNYARVLHLLVEHGANPNILVDAHPHIGSNKLPQIVSSIRETIENHGGQVIFDSKVVDFIIKEKTISGVITDDGRKYEAKGVILATGHSARDIYYLCAKKKVTIESKPYAMGVRIEHPQALIDEIQYGSKKRHENLPASSYKITCQVDSRGVFSFCMCPGGLIVPTATSPGELVVNGMSLSRRDSPYANSGFVTAVDELDFQEFKSASVFSGLKFQESVEKTFFNAGDGSQKAPAQKMTDFVHKKISDTLNSSSYIPGIYSAPLHELLPKQIYQRLSDAIIVFKNKMRGYYTEEANLVGLESRTSSPIRIPRNKENGMHIEIKGLFPCGEGAGYAGGILSAAMDGQNVASYLAKYYE